MEPVQDKVSAPEPAPPLNPPFQPIPSVREHLPSAVFGAAIPLAIYFLVRGHVHGDTQALIIAGSFSVAWVLFEALRRRRIDLVGTIVLFGFAVGVLSSTLLGGNSYVLKIRDAAFIAAFGVFCIVTLFTHGRPALFYVGRYLSAGRDPVKAAAYDSLHDLPAGRRTFRILSVVWGIGLIVEATARMIIAGVLPTGTFLAVSPFITASAIGSLFAFTVIYAKRAQMAALMSPVAMEGDGDTATPSCPS
jgi:hypothetical protein